MTTRVFLSGKRGDGRFARILQLLELDSTVTVVCELDWHGGFGTSSALLAALRKCHVLVVSCDCSSSFGVGFEVGFAVSMGIPVVICSTSGIPGFWGGNVTYVGADESMSAVIAAAIGVKEPTT